MCRRHALPDCSSQHHPPQPRARAPSLFSPSPPSSSALASSPCATSPPAPHARPSDPSHSQPQHAPFQTRVHPTVVSVSSHGGPLPPYLPSYSAYVYPSHPASIWRARGSNAPFSPGWIPHVAARRRGVCSPYRYRKAWSRKQTWRDQGVCRVMDLYHVAFVLEKSSTRARAGPCLDPATGRCGTWRCG